MKTTCMKTLGIVLVVMTSVGLVGTANAAITTVSYTVDGLGPQSFPGPVAPPSTASHVLDGLGYPGDTVELQTYTGTLDLTPGTSTQKINTLLWDVAYTYAGAGDPDDPDAGWQQLSFSLSAARNMTIDGIGPQSISQTGLLNVNWDNDYLSLSAGPTISFIVQGYQVDVTPLAVPEYGASSFPGFPRGTPWSQPDVDIMARFDVAPAPVPEPTTLIIWSLIGAFAITVSRCQRKRVA
jgi:hypothetical protein